MINALNDQRKFKEMDWAAAKKNKNGEEIKEEMLKHKVLEIKSFSVNKSSWCTCCLSSLSSGSCLVSLHERVSSGQADLVLQVKESLLVDCQFLLLLLQKQAECTKQISDLLFLSLEHVLVIFEVNSGHHELVFCIVATGAWAARFLESLCSGVPFETS